MIGYFEFIKKFFAYEKNFDYIFHDGWANEKDL